MKLPIIYGTTHDPESGEVTARVPRALKVTLGKPKDSGLHVIVAPGINPATNKKEPMFALEIGRAQQAEVRWYALEDIKILQRDYYALLRDETVVKRRAPVKIGYFSFFRENGEGGYVHDLETIAKHGVCPKEIDIIITDDAAFHGAYEFWAAKGLSCHGDGRDAMRSVNFVTNDHEKQAAAQAIANNRKWFPIVDGCYTCGCEYAKPIVKVRNGKSFENKQCGLHASLSFQLVQCIKLGAKAEFSTTGGRSTRQLLASLLELATFTGGGNPDLGTVRGIPLVLSVNQFKTLHNGTPGSAFAVKLEFRAESVAAIQRKIQEAAQTFGGMMPMVAASPAKQIAAPAVAQIAAPAEEVIEAAEVIDPRHGGDEPDDDDDVEAGFRNRQFGDGDGEEDGEAAVDETPAETFDAAKAELMLAAEAGEQPPAKEEKSPERLFAESLGGGRYEDPGEQAEAPKRRGVQFKK